jgi:Holliday junction DNA helicase RuvA
MAQGVVSLGSLEDFIKNIEKGNTDYICQVPGVGRKTAQKIIIEMKGKLDLAAEGGEDEEVIQALKNLGYPTQQARKAVKEISKETKDTGERLREALRYLSK